MCTTLTLALTFEIGLKVKYKYADRKSIYDFLFDENVCHVCHHFRDIR